jgi:hypothetical protein
MQAKGSRVQAAVVIGIVFLSSIPLVAQAPTINLKDRVLKKTHFFVFNTQVVGAGCNTVDCTATTVVFRPSIQCPAPLNSTCTYHIQVYGQVLGLTSEIGFFKFLINGAPPVGEQTETDGTFTVEGEPRYPFVHAQSYAVVATVKNRLSANQNHPVEFDIGCNDSDQVGYCTESFSYGELRVDVFVP